MLNRNWIEPQDLTTNLQAMEVRQRTMLNDIKGLKSANPVHVGFSGHSFLNKQTTRGKNGETGSLQRNLMCILTRTKR